MNSSSRREQKAEQSRQEMGQQQTRLSSRAAKELADNQGVKLIFYTLLSSSSEAFDPFFQLAIILECWREKKKKTELPAV